jgi:hypothetical protein
LPLAFGSKFTKARVTLFLNKKITKECKNIEASAFNSKALEGKGEDFSK